MVTELELSMRANASVSDRSQVRVQVPFEFSTGGVVVLKGVLGFWVPVIATASHSLRVPGSVVSKSMPSTNGQRPLGRVSVTTMSST